MGVSEGSLADRFTGCLLGMAIGDALGTPRAYCDTPDSNGASRELSYRARPARDGSEEIPPGQFSLATELALCLLETLVTSDGFVNPELATFRFDNAFQTTKFLPDSREQAAIAQAVEMEQFQSGGVSPSIGYPGPAVRAIPVALVHCLSDVNIALVTREVMRSTLTTDAAPEVVNGSLAVAHAIRLFITREVPIELIVDEVLSLIDEDEVARSLRAGLSSAPPEGVGQVVATAMHATVIARGEFVDALEKAFESGGATHLTGALAGAMCGAYAGASQIGHKFVDGLEGRAYVLMAAPAILRTSQMRAGLLFQLRIQ